MSLTRKRTSTSHSKDSAAASDSEDSAGAARAPKKAKLSAPAAAKSGARQAIRAASDAQVDDDGNPFWPLNSAGSRRIGVSMFKGRVMIGVREYYEKDSKWLPGKKGISLPMDQFVMLVEALPQIERALAEKGAMLPRPDYEGSVENSNAGERGPARDEVASSKKMNHEATSDEDEE